MRKAPLPLKTLSLGSVFLSSLLACSGPPEGGTLPEEPAARVEQSALPTRVVGYFPTWMGDVNTLQYDKLTHINYAFVLPTAQGGLSGLSSGDSRMKSLITAAHDKGVKVSISVGGWNDGDDSAFETLAANASTRTTFVNNVVSFVTAAGLDGVDIDWEYPDAGSSATNYAALMSSLGSAMHSRGKLLTAAVVANGSTGNGITSPVFDAVDFLNIMAYDGPLPNHSTYQYGVDSLNYWLGRGLAKSKAVLGVPFYGRSSTEYVNYVDLVARDSQAPYKDCVGSVCYNGIATMQKKAQYALQNGGGVMIWDLSADTTSATTSLLTAISQALQGTTPPPVYRLVNKRSGKCIDIDGPSTANGASIHQWTCHTGASQQWSLVPTDSGYSRLISSYSGKALDVKDVSTADGALLQQWDWTGGTNQQFKAVSLGNGYYRFEARHSGKVLDVTGCLSSSTDGTPIQQWTWSNNDCQQFQLQQM